MITTAQARPSTNGEPANGQSLSDSAFGPYYCTYLAEESVFTNSGKKEEAQTVTKNQYLSRDEPFGLTFQFGGTNARIAISYPGSFEPRILKVSWHEIQTSLELELNRLGIKFAEAEDLILRELAKRTLDFVAEQFDPVLGSPPFDRLVAFDFSVAGLVRGEGLDTRVTSVNSGFRMSDMAIAQELGTALLTELHSRDWHKFDIGIARVVNDAQAGLYGEMNLPDGSLRGVKTAVYIIEGTGCGSKGLVNGKVDGPEATKYDEMGHRIVWNTQTNKYEFLNDEHFAALIKEDGSYNAPANHLKYLENRLAGPWLGIRFLQEYFNDDYAGMLRALVDEIYESPVERKNPSYDEPGYREKRCTELLDIIYRLMRLSENTRKDWAHDPNIDTVNAINRIILNPNTTEYFFNVPVADRPLMAKNEPATFLKIEAALWFKKIVHSLGEAIETVAQEMISDGHPVERIVIGGGIGEHFAQFAKKFRGQCLAILLKEANLQRGQIKFSKLSPEAREAAMATGVVHEASRIMHEKATEQVREPLLSQPS